MPQPASTFQFVADKGDARSRLDRILVRRITAISRLSRTLVQDWIAGGAVLVDGRPVTRPSAHVREGASVEVALPDSAPRRTRPAPEDHPLTVLHDDDALLVVAKAPGVVVHPSYKQTSGTLLNAVLWHVRDRQGVQPGILTRLDKDTSGLVVIALNPAAHATLQRDAAAGRVVKRYLAVVDEEPRPAAGRIERAIGRDPDDRRRMMVTDLGMPSATIYETLSSSGAAGARRALVLCTLVTGRTHQIRVHLASLGCPVTGDRVYGRASAEIARHALHAWQVSLPHPVTREPLTFESALPADMQQLLGSPDCRRPHGTMPAVVNDARRRTE